MSLLKNSCLAIFTLVLIISCWISNVTGNKRASVISTNNINTTFNSEYKRHVKEYYGQIESNEYEVIRKKIEQELPYQISPQNAVLIHFRQQANNCISMYENGSNYLKSLKFNLKMSSKVSKGQGLSDFFVFTKDAYLLDQINMKKNFIMDSGFFSNNIFTEREMCSAFIIIKPDGKFLKYYGEDYYTKIKDFLKVD